MNQVNEDSLQTLVAHIRSINDQTRAWVAEDPTRRSAGLLSEDPEFWQKWYGVTTVEQFELYMIRSDYSDSHKSKYGFRPVMTGLNTIEQVKEAMRRDGLLQVQAIEPGHVDAWK